MQQNSFEGRVIRENINDTYKLKKEIGNGNYGSVRVIAKRSYLEQRFALKSIHRDRVCSDQDIKMVEKELNILMNIDHPNIIEF
jgi:serine/threonine protein kinase